MAYAARIEDLEDLFGRDPTAIALISNGVLDFLYQSFSHLLLFDGHRLTDATLSAYASAIFKKGYASAIYKKGAPLQTCRKHALKYQSVLAPDGIIIHLSGPFLGTRHDAFILQQSRLFEVASTALTIDGRHYVFYGDPAYG
ncbi:hypothetical protein PR001_g7681 [Phytophthora rubi]|uniref:DDE Tnp4 domain-containing protein n=1 Tax=Phytophthora rubi TaxID=129364 RepID=A0A6A3NDM3_9STRA|nr:hypothetical protein PR001_g7681 [Phytophthora rubi]